MTVCQISYNPAVALPICVKIWSIRFLERKIPVGISEKWGICCLQKNCDHKMEGQKDPSGLMGESMTFFIRLKGLESF